MYLVYLIRFMKSQHRISIRHCMTCEPNPLVRIVPPSKLGATQSTQRPIFFVLFYPPTLVFIIYTLGLRLVHSNVTSFTHPLVVIGSLRLHCTPSTVFVRYLRLSYCSLSTPITAAYLQCTHFPGANLQIPLCC